MMRRALRLAAAGRGLPPAQPFQLRAAPESSAESGRSSFIRVGAAEASPAHHRGTANGAAPLEAVRSSSSTAAAIAGNRSRRPPEGAVGRREIRKVMAANRGEIAIRIFRAATELGKETVAIYSKEDQGHIHRSKADEAFLVAPELDPLSAYLSIPHIIQIAKDAAVDAIHPGYGFLSERADFAQAVEDAGILFVGPRPETVQRMGDKVMARQLAVETGVPVIPGTDGPVGDVAEAKRFCEDIGFPVMLKAAYGGGGRGMRVVRTAAEFDAAYAQASSEALAAFGNGQMFIEKLVERPRHIEVQILGDGQGGVVHLFERDCSVQRRHQKVIEQAPAPNLSDALRKELCDAAVKLGRAVNYRNAGTVEFLLDQEGRYYFIEVNARLQVEHTVTEEITGVDIVQSQLLIAEGASLAELGLTQDKIVMRGAAIQARITTENPAKGFQPDIGRIEVFRSGEGMGIRLDGSSSFAGARITPHYDSLLVKVTASAQTHELASRKLSRSLVEFRIRGVSTNIPFVLNALHHPDFIAGTVDTSFIDDNPHLLKVSAARGRNRGQKLLYFLGDVAVNGPAVSGVTGIAPSHAEPVPPPAPPAKPKMNLKRMLDEEGPEAFCRAVRARPDPMITDTTFRDAHQSLLATRVRTRDLVAVAPATASALADGAFSLECWGGATFDVALRFLKECPWERLRLLREAVPDIPLQMLIRGSNAVGYEAYPDNVIHRFTQHAREAGVDVFRIFDSLNYVPNMKLGIEAIRQAGGVAEAAICYSGDLTDPSKTKYSLDYYTRVAEELVAAGAHCLAVKDMAGLLKPRAATMLITQLRQLFPDTVIHVHTHDTSGNGVACQLACLEAGADVVDAAIDSMSGMTSQPSLGAIVNALRFSERPTLIDPRRLHALSDHWAAARQMYGPFECTASMKSGSSDVYEHEIPGGQYTNLHFQTFSLGMADRWGDVKAAYALANKALGDVIKVTPSSKVVGDLAQTMVSEGITTHEELLAAAHKVQFPSSVVDFLRGGLGQPHGGFPEEFKGLVLRGKPEYGGLKAAELPPFDFEAKLEELREGGYPQATMDDVLSFVMFPEVTEEFMSFREKFGGVSSIPTPVFLDGLQAGVPMEIALERGKNVVIQLNTIAPALATGYQEVYFEFNGQPRSVPVMNRSKTATTARRTVDPKNAGSVGVAMPGTVTKVHARKGAEVVKGDVLAVLSAMKMEVNIEAPIDGTVSEVVTQPGTQVMAGDLVVVIEPAMHKSSYSGVQMVKED